MGWFNGTSLSTYLGGYRCKSIDGDTVFVHNGTYHEYVIVEKTIQLIGEDKNSTIIHMGIKINANSV
jgi:pectin methylesterase-like acyl-CoA thioesterase